MSCSVNTLSLSALSPIRLKYEYYATENYITEVQGIRGAELSFYDHLGLRGFKDAVLSRENCLILTKNQPLSGIFETSLKTFNLLDLGGTFYLKQNGKYVNYSNSDLYLDNTCCRVHNPALIIINPIDDQFVELRIGTDKIIQIKEEYPFTTEVVNITETVPSRSRFEPYLHDGVITFKIQTSEGYRFLSSGLDNVIRAVGVELNDTVVNSYHYDVEFVSAKDLVIGNRHDITEVAYYNSLKSNIDQLNVNVRKNNKKDTNLLVSLSLRDVTDEESEAKNSNVSLLKTNYSVTGRYMPSF